MVTVYIPTYNYARYLGRAIDSVLAQTYEDWELIIIDDGSTDETDKVLSRYKGHPKILSIRRETSGGIAVIANVILRLARGEYIIRLDADDYFDENALHVLSSILDRYPAVGLVYPDYYRVDEYGNVINIVRRGKLYDEVCILDLAPHGAGTLIRRECLLEIQGYDERFSCQDGVDVWLNFIEKFNPYNTNLPLFYYCKHTDSLSSDEKRVELERIKIKERNAKDISVLGIVIATSVSVYPYSGALVPLCGKPLISYTIEEAIKSNTLQKVIISTPDTDVETFVNDRYVDVDIVRRDTNEGSFAYPVRIVKELLEGKEKYDAVCILGVTTPLREYYHIDNAVYTMSIFGFDSVISVVEDQSFFYKRGKHGLVPVGRGSRDMRIEREIFYRENGAIYLVSTDIIKEGEMIGGAVGYIEMISKDSIRIHSMYEHWLTEQILKVREENVDIN